eukprot:7070052-Lingulodinium_polyedra.AAC.1
MAAAQLEHVAQEEAEVAEAEEPLEGPQAPQQGPREEADPEEADVVKEEEVKEEEKEEEVKEEEGEEVDYGGEDPPAGMEEEGGRDALSCDKACVGLTTARDFGLNTGRAEHQVVPSARLDEVVPLLQAELTATNKDDALVQE